MTVGKTTFLNLNIYKPTVKQIIMKKSDYKFHRDKKESIQNLSKENEQDFWRKSSNKPIFIPKRKKKNYKS